MTLALYFLFKVLTCSCTLFIQSRMMVAGFHYSHSNDIKYERCPGFKSHLIFVSFTFCNLKWVLRISRYMQLLSQYLTRNRFSASWQRCLALWWRKEKWRDIPTEAWSTMSIPFEGRREFLLKKNIKRTTNTYFSLPLKPRNNMWDERKWNKVLRKKKSKHKPCA